MQFSKGEWVLRKRALRNKHEQTWDGPFQVSNVVDEPTYTLRDKHDKQCNGTYHGTILRRAYSYYGPLVHHAAEFIRDFFSKSNEYYLKTFQDIMIERKTLQPNHT